MPLEMVADAWNILELPGNWSEQESEFISTFHQGVPAPQISLLLHHTLNIPGDRAREDWMRAMSWLKLEWTEARLPPDHLAIACEVLLVANDKSETLLVEELKNRYLLPWCNLASNLLASGQSPLNGVPEQFRSGIENIPRICVL
jgi:hypothetical protein